MVAKGIDVRAHLRGIGLSCQMMMLATLARRHGRLQVRHVLSRFDDWRVVVERLVSDAQLHGLAFMRQHFAATHHCARRTGC